MRAAELPLGVFRLITNSLARSRPWLSNGAGEFAFRLAVEDWKLADGDSALRISVGGPEFSSASLGKRHFHDHRHLVIETLQALMLGLSIGGIAPESVPPDLAAAAPAVEPPGARSTDSCLAWMVVERWRQPGQADRLYFTVQYRGDTDHRLVALQLIDAAVGRVQDRKPN